MRRKPLIVLKLGGSVIVGDSAWDAGAQEVRRWRDQGWDVIAVVSSIAGRTDALVQQCDQSALSQTSRARAALLSSGEVESAAQLQVALEQVGVPAVALHPGTLAFLAMGQPDDAAPIALDPTLIRANLEAEQVVVIPGFFATTRLGSTVTLGRGGSDLTALFVASVLQADKCRLVKDVDALYEWDPAAEGVKPRRFAGATFEDALNTDGTILQRKAVQFACQNAVRFELGTVGNNEGTVVGVAATEFAEKGVRCVQ